MLKRQIKSSLRHVIANMYHLTGHLMTLLQGKILILTYHRVVSEKELKQYFIQPGMYVKHDVFEKQIEFLKHHFSILSFSKLLNLCRQKVFSQEKRYCVITFDDGWLDNYIYAYPVLKKYQVSATIFLPTSFIGTYQWFWPDKISYLIKHYSNSYVPQSRKQLIISMINDFMISHNCSIPWGKHKVEIDTIIEKCKEPPEKEVDHIIAKIAKTLGVNFPNERLFLTWDMVEQMSRNGISFGSHSCNHNILTKHTLNHVVKEVEHSKRVLMRKKINYVPVFAYPNGNYNHEIQLLLRECGYKAAVTTNFGFANASDPDLFALRRINIHNDVTATLPLFTFHLSGLPRLPKS